MSSGKRVVVLPVSGGYFPVQIYMLYRSMQGCNPKDAVYLASSGGCVTFYTLALAKWDIDQIGKEKDIFRGDRYSKEWRSILPMPLISGTMYDKGNGFADIFSSRFHELKDYELWMGATSRDGYGSTAFCNLKSGDATLRTDGVATHRHIRSDVVYLDGDHKKACDAFTAAITQPVMLPAVKVDGGKYHDGGNTMASPLIPLIKSIQDSYKSYHIDYLCSPGVIDTKEGSGLLETGHNVVAAMVKAICQYDRSYLEHVVPGAKFVEGDYTEKNIERIRRARKKCKASVLEVCPSEFTPLNIFNCKQQDVIDKIQEASEARYKFKFWYKK